MNTKPQDSSELKPCEKCTSNNVLVDEDDFGGVVCFDCGWCITSEYIGTEQAIQLWNTRPLEDALRDELKAARVESQTPTNATPIAAA